MRPKTTIIAVAKQAFTPQNQINCSGYVKDVGHILGAWMPNVEANGLINFMTKSPSWIKLNNDDVEASKMAAKRYLVIAGWLNPKGHGHVVLIVPGRVNGYAKGFWGSLDHASAAGENKGIDWAFGAHKRSKVQYFATPIPALEGENQ